MSDPRPDGLPEAGRRLLDELGQLLDTVSRRAEPWAAQLRGRAAGEERHGPSCAGCPVCALSGLVRGDRPDLGAKVADQLLGLLAVLRSALDETSSAPGAAAGAPERGDAPEPAAGERGREEPSAAPDADAGSGDGGSGAVPGAAAGPVGDAAPGPSAPLDSSSRSTSRVHPIAVRWEDGC